jgi:large subunit ribosomal protein L17
VLQTVADKKVVAKLFEKIGPRFKDRKGGFTRIIRLGPRHGDAAEMVLLELVEREEPEEKK